MLVVGFYWFFEVIICADQAVKHVVHLETGSVEAMHEGFIKRRLYDFQILIVLLLILLLSGRRFCCWDWIRAAFYYLSAFRYIRSVLREDRRHQHRYTGLRTHRRLIELNNTSISFSFVLLESRTEWICMIFWHWIHCCFLVIPKQSLCHAFANLDRSGPFKRVRWWKDGVLVLTRLWFTKVASFFVGFIMWQLFALIHFVALSICSILIIFRCFVNGWLFLTIDIVGFDFGSLIKIHRLFNWNWTRHWSGAEGFWFKRFALKIRLNYAGLFLLVWFGILDLMLAAAQTTEFLIGVYLGKWHSFITVIVAAVLFVACLLLNWLFFLRKYNWLLFRFGYPRRSSDRVKHLNLTPFTFLFAFLWLDCHFSCEVVVIVLKLVSGDDAFQILVVGIAAANHLHYLGPLLLCCLIRREVVLELHVKIALELLFGFLL